MKRKWFSVLDLAVLLTVLALSLGGFLWLRTRERAESVSVFCGDECVFTLAFEDVEEPVSHTLQTERGTLTLSVERDGVCVTDAACPDGVCVRTGKIARAGESIVCAPLGVVVVLSGDGTVDGVTG